MVRGQQGPAKWNCVVAQCGGVVGNANPERYCHVLSENHIRTLLMQPSQDWYGHNDSAIRCESNRMDFSEGAGTADVEDDTLDGSRAPPANANPARYAGCTQPRGAFRRSPILMAA